LWCIGSLVNNIKGVYIMATVRMAAGSLLSTVSDTANAVSGIANTISGGVGILNSKVQTIMKKQQLSEVVELHNYETQLIKNSNLENVRLEETVRSYIGNDEAKKEAYNKYD